MAGILYGIGVGPGDAQLMTLKAVHTIRECDIIGIPSHKADSCTAYQVALKAVPELIKKPVLPVPVPMTTDKKRLGSAYKEGTRRIKELLEQGKTLGFLNLGDPTLYGTFMELAKRVKRSGYEVQLISGVPSFCAVAAQLGIPLAQKGEAIHILPGFYHLEGLEGYEGTRVLMKSAGRLSEVKEKLIELERAGKGKAYAVTNCGMEGQAVYREIESLDEKAGYFTTIIVKEERDFKQQ